MTQTTRVPRIIVTGLTGLVGSSLTRLEAPGVEFMDVSLDSGVDITDPNSLDRALDSVGPSNALIHLAAFTNVSAAYEERGKKDGACYRVNVLGTQAIAEACRRRAMHLIHISTDFVFDGASSGYYTESDEPNPIEWYGETKLLAEKAAMTAPEWTIVRIAFPYAPEPAPRGDLVRNLLKKLSAGEAASLFDDQIITPTFAPDIARGLFLLLRERPNREIFHIVGSETTTPHQVGVSIATEFGFDPALVGASKLAGYLNSDPRPRQKALRMSNIKWTAFAARHGLARPLGIREGLKVLRNSPAGRA